MALTPATKRVIFGDQSTGLINFATDGTNYWPLSVLADSNGNIISDSSAIPISGTINGSVTALAGGAITNPASTLQRPATPITPYAAGQLIGTSVTGTTASTGVPSFAILTSAGGAILPGFTLMTNATTGWLNVGILVNLWLSHPTYANGDGGAYVVTSGVFSSGTPNWIGSINFTFTQQLGDGAVSVASPLGVNEIALRLASGTSVFWDMMILNAATPIASQKFFLIPGVLN